MRIDPKDKTKNEMTGRTKSENKAITRHAFQAAPISNSELPYQKSMDTDRCTAFSWRESRWLVVGTSSRSSSRSQLSAASCE